MVPVHVSNISTEAASLEMTFTKFACTPSQKVLPLLHFSCSCLVILCQCDPVVSQTFAFFNLMCRATQRILLP